MRNGLGCSKWTASKCGWHWFCLADYFLTIFLSCRRDVATFVNAYPSLEVSHELQQQETFTAGTPIVLSVTLSRDVDDDEGDDTQAVIAPLYPAKKLANWWLVIGDSTKRQLLAIRKVTVRKSLTAKLEFTLPQGQHALKLYVICDSYSGADQDLALDSITVAEGDGSDDEDEDEDSSGDEEMEE